MLPKGSVGESLFDVVNLTGEESVRPSEFYARRSNELRDEAEESAAL